MEVGEIRWYGRTLSKELKDLMVLFISDLHYGNPNCSVKHFLRTVEYIKNNENAYCFLNGDLCESALKTSKGDIYKQVGSPDDQKKQVTEWLLPIKDKVLGMTTGNHEARISEIAGVDISGYIAEQLNVPYRPEGLLFKLSFGDNSNRTKGQPEVFWVYMSHGYGGARTKASKAVKVERMSTWIHADCYAMSHDHVVNAAPDIYLMPDNRGTVDKKTGFTSGKVTAHREMLIKTAAYLKWGGYSEMGGFPPSDLTTPVTFFLTPGSDKWSMFPDKPRKAVRVVV
jgi:Icc-related predicted phosphoesterase